MPDQFIADIFSGGSSRGGVFADFSDTPADPPAGMLGESRLTEAAPGPPPRPGLVWNDQTHRWTRPGTGDEYRHDTGHGEGRDVTGSRVGAKGGQRHRVIDKSTTHEGVKPEHAKELTPAEMREVLAFHDGMTQVGSNGPNARLPDAARPKGLSDVERGALQKYSYKNDRVLNGILRGGSTGDSADGKQLAVRRDDGRAVALSPYPAEFFWQMHAAMQSAFDKTPVLARPVTVVRGMNLPPEALAGFLEKLKGGSVTFDGYTSTAAPGGLAYKLGLADATKSIPEAFRGNVQLKITAVHGIDMSPHSQLPGEQEFLLNHGSTFEVKKVIEKNGAYTVELEQVPPAKKAGESVVRESSAGRQEGEVWRGPSGRWFTLRAGRVVPTKAPGGTGQSAGEIHAAVAGAHHHHQTTKRDLKLAQNDHTRLYYQLEAALKKPQDEAGAAEVAHLRAQTDLAREHHRHVSAEHDKAKARVRQALVEGLGGRVANPARFSSAPGPIGRSDAKDLPPPTPAQQQVFDDAHAFLGAICNWPGGGAPPPYKACVSKDGRAFCSRDGTVAMGATYESAARNEAAGLTYSADWDKARATETHVHELGHHIEHHKPGVLKKAEAFLDRRAGGESPQSLKQLFPRMGYGADEFGAKDDFEKAFPGTSAYYVGKVYPNATEIVSMGVEKLYSDPGGFALADPDYFKFMVEVLTS